MDGFHRAHTRQRRCPELRKDENVGALPHAAMKVREQCSHEKMWAQCHRATTTRAVPRGDYAYTTRAQRRSPRTHRTPARRQPRGPRAPAGLLDDDRATTTARTAPPHRGTAP